MTSSIRETLVIALLGAIGCGSEAPPVESAPIVFVGPARGDDSSVNVLVGAVAQAGRLRFFACGDEPTDTTSAWLDVDGVDPTSAESPIASAGDSSIWRLDGVVSTGRASGTLLEVAHDGEPGRVFDWDADTVASTEPNGPGLYSDGAGCETGVIVTATGEIQGSYCAAEQREQVTPLTPAAAGLLVQLEQGTEVLVTRVLPRAE